jgi:beta-N-acetylhexosaminidase
MCCKNAAIQVQIQNPNGHRLKKVLILLGLWMSCFVVSGQDRRDAWVDSTFQTLTIPEKISQLFMVSVSISNKESILSLENKIKAQPVGGLIITHSGAGTIASLSNRLRRVANVPLLMGVSAPAGLGDVLDSTMTFFQPMAISAMDDTLAYQLGRTISRQMKLVGLHINFAPQVDVYRGEFGYENYFSDDVRQVATKSISFTRGLQDGGVIACAKQFPKINVSPITFRDSVIYFELNRADTSELYPHLRLIKNGIQGLLINNFSFSMLENNKKKPIPPAESSAFINEVLKKTAGFDGLTFVEIPALKKVAVKRKKGETELLAFQAGNDVLIDPDNLHAAVRYLQKYLKKNPSWLPQLETSVQKILRAKYDAGLATRSPLPMNNLQLRLHRSQDNLFKNQLAEHVVTVVKNQDAAIPVQSLENKIFASVTIGTETQTEFDHYLSKYIGIQKFSVRSLSDTTGLARTFAMADVILVSVFPSSSSYIAQVAPQIRKFAGKKLIILCHFANPLALNYFANIPSVLVAYDDDPLLQQKAAQIIFGGLGSNGVLPIRVSSAMPRGQGVTTPSFDRLSYSIPEAAGMDSKTLEQIKNIAQEAIDLKATPGCQVLVAKDGKVVYEQSFGSFTYENKTPVTDETLYDLASVTKVSATLQTVMFMQEKGLIDVNKKISVYLPELKTSNKKDFTIKDVLTHQAGLWPFLPFWAQTVKDSVQLPEYYSRTVSPDFPFPVAENLFASKSMKDSLWQWIIKAKIRDKDSHHPYDYRYSDMGFYIFQHLAEKILNQPMDDFLEQNIYEILGAYTTGYLPLRKFPASRIAPTEDDKLFRRSLLTGYVHDQGAAMHGGIAGHAGLFSTANDLAKLGQMWLQKGTYGGHRYFKPETIEFFTQKQYENSRRGLGWDKPVQSDPNGPTSVFASPATFGHTGFTGISIWIDPVFNLVFIFFSNRVYPEMTNNKILNANIRPRIQDVVYKSIFTYGENHP